MLGTVVAATSYRRWRETERAMRAAEPLSRHALPGVLAVTLSMLAAVTAALFLMGPLGAGT